MSIIRIPFRINNNRTKVSTCWRNSRRFLAAKSKARASIAETMCPSVSRAREENENSENCLSCRMLPLRGTKSTPQLSIFRPHVATCGEHNFCPSRSSHRFAKRAFHFRRCGANRLFCQLEFLMNI